MRVRLNLQIDQQRMDVSRIDVIIADNHQIFIEGIKVVMQRFQRLCCQVIGEANTGRAALELMRQQPVHLLLLDLNLPDMGGLEVISAIRSEGFGARIITLGIYDEPKIIKAAFKAGSDGYLLKTAGAAELSEAVEVVMTGMTYLGKGLSLTSETGMNARFLLEGKFSISYDDNFVKRFSLTKRELEVLKLIGKAMTNKEIAQQLYISDQTASVHRKNIMRKTGVSSTASLIKMAFENNLL